LNRRILNPVKTISWEYEGNGKHSNIFIGLIFLLG
jgi:hypothetical protein